MADTTQVQQFRSTSDNGGPITATQSLTGTPKNLFLVIGKDELDSGIDHYKCVYFKNVSSEDMEEFKLWLDADSQKGDSTYKWGFDNAGPGGYRWAPGFVATGSNFDDTASTSALDRKSVV